MGKTNFEYLKDICFGNDEALEFIEAAENQMADIKEKLRDAQDDACDWEDKFDEKQPNYPNVINAGIGVINWSADNLQLQLVMEALAQKIESIGALKVLRLLEVRPKSTAV